MRYNRLKLLPWVLITSLVAAAIEIDVTVPGFPQMVKYFVVTESDIQQTLSINFIGLCLTVLIFGPLSDVFGRRKLMLLGFGLFSFGSLGCALAQELFVVYIYRFVQGLGSSSIWVICFVIIADCYKGRKASTLIGIMDAVLAVSLAIAPVIGSILCAVYNWRATYILVAILSLGSFLMLYYILPETKVTKTKKLTIKLALKNYRFLLFDFRFMIYLFIPTLLSVSYIIYLSSVSFLYIDKQQMSFMEFALHQTFVVVCFALTSFYIGKLTSYFGTIRTIIIGTIICFCGTIMLIMSSYFTPLSFTTSMGILALGQGILYSLIFALSMELFPELKGESASLIMFFRFILSSLGIVVASKYYTGLLIDTALMISMASFIAIGMMIYVIYDKYKILNVTKLANKLTP